jgi:hypothetical protein
MNRQKFATHCLLVLAVLIALAWLWQPAAAKSRVYRLQAGETIRLGKQGLQATNIPREFSQVYLDAVGADVPARFRIKLKSLYPFISD